MQLHEQYRPRVWGDVVGQGKALARIEAIARRGLGGRAYWVSGASGTGKTTVARLIAAEVASEDFIVELDASDCAPSRLREIEHDAQYLAWGKGGRAYLINEAHGLRADSMRALLLWLERLPDHVVVVFTTTSEAQGELFESKVDAGPLLSRCVEIALSRQALAKPFAERAREIATKEGLNGRDIGAYVKLAQRCKNNFRAMLQEIESGSMIGE